MVVSLKANKKRIIAFLLLAAVVVGACLLLRGNGETEPVKEISGETNEERVAYLQSFGWQVETEPAETREVMIPAQFNDVYTTYNVMQKAQGFDLKPYAGETCTQYKYKVTNYPGETEVYATLLVYGKLIVGGDLACAEVDGFMHGFAPDSARYGETGKKNDASPASEGSQPASGSSGSSVTESGLPESGTESSAVQGDAQLSSAAQEESAAGGEDAENVESTAGEAIPEEAFPTD